MQSFESYYRRLKWKRNPIDDLKDLERHLDLELSIGPLAHEFKAFKTVDEAIKKIEAVEVFTATA